MAPVGHQAVVLRVPHIMRPCWIFLPPIVPAPDTLTFISHEPSVAYNIHAFVTYVSSCRIWYVQS